MTTHPRLSRSRRASLLATLACLLGLPGVRAGEPAAVPLAAAVALQPGRPEGSRVHEPAALSELQRRLDVLSAAADAEECLTAYAAHKAQAWVNFARYAAAEQLPAATQTAAQHNAGELLGSLERHEAAALEVPELPGAQRVRDDLWRAIAAVKGDGRLCAAPKMTAYCEVELAWVDYEASAGGWRHADPYVRIAEDYCGSAVAARPAAIPPPAAPLVTPVGEEAPGAGTAAPPPAAPPLIERTDDIVLSVVFPHNRARRADIRAPGRAALARLSERLRALPQGSVLLIVGHADRTGRPDYNLRLSAQRARSVAAELRALGVRAQFRLGAVGSTEPVVQCALDDEVAERRRYLACLEPNRRVFIHLIPAR